MWGALLTAGSTLLSGWFNRRKQQAAQSIDYAGMVRDAQAAGFNPLTALRNGGAAGYSQTSLPANSLSGIVGEALASGMQYYAQHDPMINKGLAREHDRLRAETSLANSQAAYYRRLGTGEASTRANALAAPKIQTSSKKISVPAMSSRTDGSRTTALLRGSLGTSAFEQGKATVTNPWGRGVVNAKLADAEIHEARYGEPVSWLAGVGNLAGDYDIQTDAAKDEIARSANNALGTGWRTIKDIGWRMIRNRWPMVPPGASSM